MGGKWNHTQVHQQDLLTGWLILPTEQAKELVVNSGRQGVFAQIQENNTGPRPIRWFQRQNNENAETYLQRCLKEAKLRKVGLFFSKKQHTTHHWHGKNSSRNS